MTLTPHIEEADLLGSRLPSRGMPGRATPEARAVDSELVAAQRRLGAAVATLTSTEEELRLHLASAIATGSRATLEDAAALRASLRRMLLQVERAAA